MADDQPPWATRKYSTPPPSESGQGASSAPSGDIPGTSRYSTPPPSPPPPPPPSDPFIRDLQDPGWQGTAARGAAGVTQGFILDPIEKAGELTGIGQNPPKWLEDRLEATRKAAGEGIGEGGRVVGSVANPLWRLLPAIRATEYAGPAARALARLATSIYQGTIGGAAQPTGAKTPAEAAKQTVPQLLEGGGIGAVLGAPGALAASRGFETLQQPVREFIRHMPLEIRRLEGLRNLDRPAFTDWWHRQSLEPIGGGKVPGVASKATMDKVGMQIGGAIDNATALMSLDTTNPSVRQALGKVRGDAAINLASSGDALRAYNKTIDDLVTGPLVVNGGRLNPARLRQITSNLDAHIRAIDPSKSPDNKLLRSELENYRFAMFDNATGTQAQKKAYANAREAWRRHAIGRDSQPLGEEHGHLDPTNVARELDRRNPLSYPYGGPRGRPDPLQRAVNQAQQAMWNMRGGARRGMAGKPLRELGDFARPAAAAGSITAPLSYSWPDQQQ